MQNNLFYIYIYIYISSGVLSEDDGLCLIYFAFTENDTLSCNDGDGEQPAVSANHIQICMCHTYHIYNMHHITLIIHVIELISGRNRGMVVMFQAKPETAVQDSVSMCFKVFQAKT